MTTDPQTDRTTEFYDALVTFQNTHRLPGLQHAQIRGLLAEHLARTVPAAAPAAVPPADRAGLRELIAGALSEARRPGLGGMTEADAVAYMADAVLALLFGPIPADIDTATWTAIRAIQLMNEAGQQRDAIRERAVAGDRAAVLREAAEALDGLTQQPDMTMPEGRWRAGLDAGIRELRRLADEERDEREAQAHLDQAEDICRPVGIGGETMRVHGAAEMSTEGRAALAEVTAIVKRGMAAETPGPETQGAHCGCPHPADEHSVYGCVDGCGCEWMPKRKPMDPVRILGIDACPTPLTHNWGCGCPTDQAPAVVAEPSKEN